MFALAFRLMVESQGVGAGDAIDQLERPAAAQLQGRNDSQHPRCVPGHDCRMIIGACGSCIVIYTIETVLTFPFLLLINHSAHLFIRRNQCLEVQVRGPGQALLSTSSGAFGSVDKVQVCSAQGQLCPGGRGQDGENAKGDQGQELADGRYGP